MKDTEKRSRISELLMHLLGHASWRIIEWILAALGAVIVASLLLLTQWFRHHWDIIAIIVVFAGSLALFVAIGRMLGASPRQQPSADQKEEPSFSADRILIFSNGPVLFLNRQRSHVEFQMNVFSTLAVELLFVEAKIICNGTEVTALESSRPLPIPALNPQAQVVGKSLTEKELQRFDSKPGTFFQIAGNARFRWRLNKDVTVPFSFNVAAWWLG